MPNLQKTSLDFLFLIGDFHFRSTQPSKRKTSLLQAALDKFHFIKETINEITQGKSFKILFNGDLTHSPVLSMRECNTLLSELDKLGRDNLIFNIGNHDLFQRSYTNPEDNFEKTFLRSFDLVKPNPDLHFELGEDLYLVLFPDTPTFKDLLFNLKDRENYYAKLINNFSIKTEIILAAHSNISNCEGNNYSTHFNQLSYSKQERLVYFSDIHQPYQDIINDTNILNTGSLLRDDLADIHNPHFAYLDLKSSLTPSIIQVPCPDYFTAFNTIKKTETNKTEKLLRKDSSLVLRKELPILEITKNILQSSKASSEAKDYVRELIETHDL